MRIKNLVTALCILLYCAQAMAESSSDSSLQQEIDVLQLRLQMLEAQENTSIGASLPQVSIGPYFGLKSYFNGKHLIVHNSNVNEDVKLLELRKKEIHAYERAGQSYPDTTKIIFSGELEATATYEDPYEGSTPGTTFNLTDAELDSFIEGNRWVSGFMTFVYDDKDDNEANVVNNSQVKLDQGFVTLGDFSTLPVYSSFGQMYLPFGLYSNDMVTNPSTKKLGRIQARGISLGYHADDKILTPYAAIFGYQGATELDDNSGSNQTIDEYGSNFGVTFKTEAFSWQLGGSYTSNIAESSGLQGDGESGSKFKGFAQDSNSEELAYRVPGLDIHSKWIYQQYKLFAEYTWATKAFDENDLSFDGQGAQPKAFDLQAVYTFDSQYPSDIAIEYGRTWEALAIKLPEKNYGITYSISFWSNTLLSLEVMHEIGYPSGSTATGNDRPVNLDEVGSSDNSVKLCFDLYF